MKKFFFVLISLLIAIQAIQFEVELDHYSRTCFKEFIGDGSAYHFEVTAQKNGKYEFSLIFKDGSILYKNPREQLTKKIDSFSAASDSYNFCIENLSEKQRFSIRYLTGIELSDVRFFPKAEDSKEIGKLINSLNEVYNEIRKREEYSMTVNEYNMQLQKLVSFKSVGFGFLSITVVLIISFLHYLQIKRVLKNRKII